MRFSKFCSRKLVRPGFLYALASLFFLIAILPPLLGIPDGQQFFIVFLSFPVSLFFGPFLFRWLNLFLEVRVHPDVLGEQTVEIHDFHIYKKTSESEASFDWHIFRDIVDDGELLIFLVDEVALLTFLRPKDSRFLVPKRAFHSTVAAQEFYEMARRFWMNAKMGLTDGETPEGVWPPAPRRDI